MKSREVYGYKGDILELLLLEFSNPTVYVAKDDLFLLHLANTLSRNLNTSLLLKTGKCFGELCTQIGPCLCSLFMYLPFPWLASQEQLSPANLLLDACQVGLLSHLPSHPCISCHLSASLIPEVTGMLHPLNSPMSWLCLFPTKTPISNTPVGPPCAIYQKKGILHLPSFLWQGDWDLDFFQIQGIFTLLFRVTSSPTPDGVI